MIDSLIGILPAVITPLDSNGVFLPATFERLLERLYEAGVHGVYVCGQTGEGHSLPIEQRIIVSEAAVKFSPPGKLIIAQVGARSTADAVALARHARNAG